MGYRPWGKAQKGESLWDYHQACVRMLRADYCGNGKPHTRDGTRIELWDRLDIQVDTHEQGLSFEGAQTEGPGLDVDEPVSGDNVAIVTPVLPIPPEPDCRPKQ